METEDNLLPPATGLIFADNPMTDDCRRVSQILAKVGDKWSILVVMLLRDGPRRFTQIKRSLDGISQRMLTITLRSLERDGMLIRTVVPTRPPQVHYELTELGTSLSAPVIALGQWANSHMAQIDAARASFDKASDERLV